MTETWSQYIRKLMKDKNYVVFVASDSEKIVGYAICRIDRMAPIYRNPKVAIILDLYVGLSTSSRVSLFKGLTGKMIK